MQEKELKLIAVSGTHGKTTTTGMIIWAFKALGLPVSYSIGTTLSFGPPAQYQPDSQYFIYECDEFDRNFLNFTPHKSIITNCDYDHPDTYPTKLEYEQAFKQFINQSGHSYLWNDCLEKLNISETQKLTVAEKTTDLFDVSLSGQHNRENAWLALLCLSDLLSSVEPTDILNALNTFPGTQRRFEMLVDNLYTDYAHHPAEIAATIQRAKEQNSEVVVVYQPHQNIRQHELLKNDGYGDVFSEAKKLIGSQLISAVKIKPCQCLPQKS